MRAVISAISLDAGDTMLHCDPSPAETSASALGRFGPAVDAGVVGPVLVDAWKVLQARIIDRDGRCADSGYQTVASLVEPAAL
jgi:hypothetical protein